MDNMYKGVENVTGEEYNVEDVECERRPFRAVLDVGIRSTTTGTEFLDVLKELLMEVFSSHTLKKDSLDMLMVKIKVKEIMMLVSIEKESLEFMLINT
jgi:hypothetical protein